MTKLILSTSNIMGGGPSIIRRPVQKSNIEFVSSLRSNFSAAQQAASHSQTNGDTRNHTNGDSTYGNPDWKTWTTSSGSSIYMPSLHTINSGLLEERSSYEITVKLFFLPNKPASCRCAQTREAIRLVLDELHIKAIDLLIVSYPGIAFDAEDEDGEEYEAEREADGGKDTRALNGDCERSEADPEDVDTMISTWECLEEQFDRGVISRLGVSEFSAERLSRFLRKARIKPAVNQINVKDCCVVPKPLILFAKKEGVELLTHNDCTNILPKGTVRELLGPGDTGAGVLAAGTGAGGLEGDIEPQWVIKYTAVVQDRGVIENKGYFALAEVADGADG